MKSSTTYRNWLIRSGSFRLERNGPWIPQYSLTPQEPDDKQSDAPIYHVECKTSFQGENDADDFALQEARRWIDLNRHEVSSRPPDARLL